MGLIVEIRRGIVRTAPYLLSHHLPGVFDRCYEARVRGRTIRLCARCCGIYPGILVGAVAALSGQTILRALVLVYLLPAPALLEWLATANGNRGSNRLRTATGFLLGYAYGLGLVWLLAAREPLVLVAAVGYGVLAVALVGFGGDRAPRI